MIRKSLTELAAISIVLSGLSNLTGCGTESCLHNPRKYCEQNGGEWGKVEVGWHIGCSESKEGCLYPTNDSGTPCTDSLQCEGYCIAPMRSEKDTEFYCSPRHGFFSDECHDVLINGYETISCSDVFCESPID